MLKHFGIFWYVHTLLNLTQFYRIFLASRPLLPHATLNYSNTITRKLLSLRFLLFLLSFKSLLLFLLLSSSLSSSSFPCFSFLSSFFSTSSSSSTSTSFPSCFSSSADKTKNFTTRQGYSTSQLHSEIQSFKILSTYFIRQKSYVLE